MNLTSDQKVGCEHYRRKLKFIAPCCGKVYVCRFCHDEHEDHQVIRHEIKEVLCSICGQRQSIAFNCSNCQVRFGTYSCLKCNLFSDDDRIRFHCDSCGFCRIGYENDYFHCNTCDVCLPINLKFNHKCIDKISQTKCSICLEDIHTSRNPFRVPQCMHLIHKICYNQYIDAGFKTCPICQKSIADLTHYWTSIDSFIQNNPIPAFFQQYRVQVMCRDCNKESVAKLHYIGYKCYLCGSYNTYTNSRFFRSPINRTNKFTVFFN